MYRSGTLPSVGTTAVAPSDRLPTWCPQDSANLYRVDAWGGGYFGVTPHGTVAVYPDADPTRSIDLYDVVRGLAARDLTVATGRFGAMMDVELVNDGPVTILLEPPAGELP